MYLQGAVYMPGKNGPEKVYDSLEDYEKAEKSGEIGETSYFWLHSCREAMIFPVMRRDMEQRALILGKKEIHSMLEFMRSSPTSVARLNSKYEMKEKFGSVEEFQEKLEKNRLREGNYCWIEEMAETEYLVFLSFLPEKAEAYFYFTKEDLETMEELLGGCTWA